MKFNTGVSAFGFLAWGLNATVVERAIYCSNGWQEGEKPRGHNHYFCRWAGFPSLNMQLFNNTWRGDIALNNNSQEEDCRAAYVTVTSHWKAPMQWRPGAYIHSKQTSFRECVPFGTSVVFAVSDAFTGPPHTGKLWLVCVRIWEGFLTECRYWPTVESNTVSLDFVTVCSKGSSEKLPGVATVQVSTHWPRCVVKPLTSGRSFLAQARLSPTFGRDSERSSPSLDRYRYVAGLCSQ